MIHHDLFELILFIV